MFLPTGVTIHRCRTRRRPHFIHKKDSGQPGIRAEPRSVEARFYSALLPITSFFSTKFNFLRFLGVSIELPFNSWSSLNCHHKHANMTVLYRPRRNRAKTTEFQILECASVLDPRDGPAPDTGHS